jgi:hypothetical protein
MIQEPRRMFILRLAASTAALGTSTLYAQAPRVDENDEAAVALGYRNDTTRVDAKKYPNHDASQKCINCSFWQGQPSDAWAGCAMFGRKQIAAGGWCMAWKKVG